MPVEKDELITEEQLDIFKWAIITVMTIGIDIFGIVTNIINICCFWRQGFSDTVNISFFGLAISDLACLLTVTWTNVCITPAFSKLDLPFEPLGFEYLTGAWPHVIFTRVTSWITAFVTLERCLCITIPLKVKLLLTPTRVTVIIVAIFLVQLLSSIPIYHVNRLGWSFSPERNKSIISLMFTADRQHVEAVTFAVNNVFLQFSAFIITFSCTLTLIAKLKQTTKWRQQSTNLNRNDETCNRDKTIGKMVIAVSSLFVACFTPVCLISLAMIIEPEFSIEGHYTKMFVVFVHVGFFLESANSSMNIFIYYRMSSKFRAAFRHLILRSE